MKIEDVCNSLCFWLLSMCLHFHFSLSLVNSKFISKEMRPHSYGLCFQRSLNTWISSCVCENSSKSAFPSFSSRNLFTTILHSNVVHIEKFAAIWVCHPSFEPFPTVQRSSYRCPFSKGKYPVESHRFCVHLLLSKNFFQINSANCFSSSTPNFVYFIVFNQIPNNTFTIVRIFFFHLKLYEFQIHEYYSAIWITFTHIHNIHRPVTQHQLTLFHFHFLSLENISNKIMYRCKIFRNT